MRQKKSALLISCFFSAVLSFQPNAFAQRIDEASYRYPYKDPYLATMTSALMQGSENPPTSEIEDLHIKVLDHRNDVYLLEGMGAIR
ncbi:MAG TPA: alpha/beta hydrolase, partial [Methylobacter sp.]